MVIIEDTRNKVGKHDNVRLYCEAKGIEIVRQKLQVGDYSIPGGKISIDTKENLSEVATNLMNRSDSARFLREVRRSVELGVRLIVLVEHGGKIESINDVPKWKSNYSQVTGRRLLDEMIRLEMAYRLRWEFCSKKETGKRIIEFLKGKT